jgi:hypothetical protein
VDVRPSELKGYGGRTNNECVISWPAVARDVRGDCWIHNELSQTGGTDVHCHEADARCHQQQTVVVHGASTDISKMEVAVCCVGLLRRFVA